MFSLKRLLKIGLSATLIALLSLAGLYITMRSELPSVVVLKDIKWQTPMKIYSTEGLLISQFGEKKRIPLTLNEMPKSLINAILATEDNRFYQHFGIDPIGIARAVFAKLIGKSKGGASTITQQVARNFFLSSVVHLIPSIIGMCKSVIMKSRSSLFLIKSRPSWPFDA